MQNFDYHISTKAHFGKGKIECLSRELRLSGGKRVLLVYGGGSIKKNGIYDSVTNQLNHAEIAFVEFSGIKPNPEIEDVYRAIQVYRENNLDFILAVGGGSVIDSSKAIAAGVAYPGDVFDFMCGQAQITSAAPLAAVLTMAGTGSELNTGAVITVGNEHRKFGLKHPILAPKFSILDPTYTYTVPRKHTAAGAFDAFNHAMEAYFKPGSDTVDVQNMTCEGLMKSIVKNAPKLLQEPKDYDARANVMWASSLAASTQFLVGKTATFPTMHMIGHELSSLYDMTHGETLALVTPSWMKFSLINAPEYTWLFAQFARNVFDVIEADDRVAADRGVREVEAFIETLELPATLEQAGVERDKLKYLAEKAVAYGNIGSICRIEKDEVLEILTMAY